MAIFVVQSRPTLQPHGLQHTKFTSSSPSHELCPLSKDAKLMSIESVIPSNYLVLCCSLLLLPSIFPSIRLLPNESALEISGPDF